MRHLSSCLSPSFRVVKEQADKLLKMNNELQRLLPDMMRIACFVADYQKGCLTIGVADAVWMTALRYELPSLRDRLRQEAGWHGLTSIQLKIQPSLYTLHKQETTHVQPELTPVTQAALNTLRQLRLDIESSLPSSRGEGRGRG